jgi:hypothetical protein
VKFAAANKLPSRALVDDDEQSVHTEEEASASDEE